MSLLNLYKNLDAIDGIVHNAGTIAPIQSMFDADDAIMGAEHLRQCDRSSETDKRSLLKDESIRIIVASQQFRVEQRCVHFILGRHIAFRKQGSTCGHDA